MTLSGYSYSVSLAPPDVSLSITGELDSCSAAQASAAVSRALSDGGRRLRVDLAEVDFIDAAGISLLVRLHREVGDLGGVMEVDAASGCVRRLCTLVGVERVLGIEPLRWPRRRPLVGCGPAAD